MAQSQSTVSDATAPARILEPPRNRLGGGAIVAGVLVFVLSLAISVTRPGDLSHVELVQQPFWAAGVALNFVSLALITLGLLYLARDIYTRGQRTLLLPAVGAIGSGALLHFAEHAIRGFAAPTVVNALERTADAELVLEAYVAFGTGLLIVGTSLIGLGIALLALGLYRTSMYRPAVGIIGVLVGSGLFGVAAITFLGIESPAVPLALLVVYGYLLVLGTVMLRSSGGQPEQDAGATA